MARSTAAFDQRYEDIVYKYDEYWEPHTLLRIGHEDIVLKRPAKEFNDVIYLVMRERTTRIIL